MALSHSNGEFIKKLDFFAIGKKKSTRGKNRRSKSTMMSEASDLTLPEDTVLSYEQEIVREKKIGTYVNSTSPHTTFPLPDTTCHPPPFQTHTNTKEWNVQMSKARVNWNNSTYILVNVCYLQEYKINLLISFLKVASKLKKIDWL